MTPTPEDHDHIVLAEKLLEEFLAPKLKEQNLSVMQVLTCAFAQVVKLGVDEEHDLDEAMDIVDRLTRKWVNLLMEVDAEIEKRRGVFQ